MSLKSWIKTLLTDSDNQFKNVAETDLKYYKLKKILQDRNLPLPAAGSMTLVGRHFDNIKRVLAPITNPFQVTRNDYPELKDGALQTIQVTEGDKTVLITAPYAPGHRLMGKDGDILLQNDQVAITKVVKGADGKETAEELIEVVRLDPNLAVKGFDAALEETLLYSNEDTLRTWVSEDGLRQVLQSLEYRESPPAGTLDARNAAREHIFYELLEIKKALQAKKDDEHREALARRSTKTAATATVLSQS